MAIAPDIIKQLREETGAGVMTCKKILEETKGDLAKAKEVLKKKGVEIAAKKASRTASQGRIVSYIHHNHKVGVLVEVNCETDFVAKNEEFITFCKDLAMHIVAANPLSISRQEVSKNDIPEKEAAEDFYKRSCLLEQAFIKDDKISIGDYLNSLIAKTGENIVIRRFVRYSVGEAV